MNFSTLKNTCLLFSIIYDREKNDVLFERSATKVGRLLYQYAS